MPLPDLIEMMPLEKPAGAVVTVPGSKSITNRALILAALAESRTELEGALWSEDTQVMVEALQKLGFEIEVRADPNEPCNRNILVRGLGGRISKGGTEDHPLELFVGNAGTAARFLAALVCLGQGAYRLHGVVRMHERPQAALFGALRELGYRIETENDKLPAVIHGHGPRPASCSVSLKESSQFASALLLCAQAGNWSVRIEGDDAEEAPYVEMTRQMIATFPQCGGAFAVEPDASSGSYFWAAGWLYPVRSPRPVGDERPAPSFEGEPSRPKRAAEASQQMWECFGAPIIAGQTCEFAVPWPWPEECPSCVVRNWPKSDWQIDSQFPRYWPLPPTLSRRTQLGDSIMTAVVLAPLGPRPVRFTDLGRLRVQECERVAALRTELTKCGAEVFEQGDELRVLPSRLHGAEIATYHDHRMAMCFAILGLKVPGIRLKNPACVKKTFPNFFQKMAVPPPRGLGAEILDAATRRPLKLAELFAE
ncbi:MAG: 3-phosphoshikimate 1-carboxyvinyltransferase [Verrucomicrobia bacterium]|nr:3-phosphoshikimate 1-carboxyvinyltransferase [Verrucomicrobiota bacterium]